MRPIPNNRQGSVRLLRVKQLSSSLLLLLLCLIHSVSTNIIWIPTTEARPAPAKLLRKRATTSPIDTIQQNNAMTSRQLLEGGTTVASGRYPYFVSLQLETRNGNIVCSGSLIHEDLVMTTASCAQDLVAGTVLVGPTSQQDSSTSTFATTIAGWVVNPDYNAVTNQDDVMLVRLAVAAPSTLTPIYYNRLEPTIPAVGQSVRVLGFQTDDTSNTADSPLQVGTVQVFSAANCNNNLGLVGAVVDSDMICAGAAGNVPTVSTAEGPFSSTLSF